MEFRSSFDPDPSAMNNGAAVTGHDFIAAESSAS